MTWSQASAIALILILVLMGLIFTEGDRLSAALARHWRKRRRR